MKKSRERYKDKLLLDQMKDMEYCRDFVEPETLASILRYRNMRKLQDMERKRESLLKIPDYKKKPEDYFHLLDSKGYIPVDRRGFPPSKLFNKLIKAGILRRNRIKWHGIYRRTCVERVI